jgi:hypothetical protein
MRAGHLRIHSSRRRVLQPLTIGVKMVFLQLLQDCLRISNSYLLSSSEAGINPGK